MSDDRRSFTEALTRVAVPPENRELSPVAGLTGGHWPAAAIHWADGAPTAIEFDALGWVA